jgi:hypothetical protein
MQLTKGNLTNTYAEMNLQQIYNKLDDELKYNNCFDSPYNSSLKILINNDELMKIYKSAPLVYHLSKATYDDLQTQSAYSNLCGLYKFHNLFDNHLSHRIVKLLQYVANTNKTFSEMFSIDSK